MTKFVKISGESLLPGQLVYTAPGGREAAEVVCYYKPGFSSVQRVLLRPLGPTEYMTYCEPAVKEIVQESPKVAEYDVVGCYCLSVNGNFWKKV